VPSLPNVNGNGNMVNGYIRPLSVENNHKTAALLNSSTNGTPTVSSSNSSSTRINDFKSPHSQSQFNLDPKKTKNFLQEKSAVINLFNFLFFFILKII